MGVHSSWGEGYGGWSESWGFAAGGQSLAHQTFPVYPYPMYYQGVLNTVDNSLIASTAYGGGMFSTYGASQNPAMATFTSSIDYRMNLTSVADALYNQSLQGVWPNDTLRIQTDTNLKFQNYSLNSNLFTLQVFSGELIPEYEENIINGTHHMIKVLQIQAPPNDWGVELWNGGQFLPHNTTWSLWYPMFNASFIDLSLGGFYVNVYVNVSSVNGQPEYNASISASYYGFANWTSRPTNNLSGAIIIYGPPERISFTQYVTGTFPGFHGSVQDLVDGSFITLTNGGSNGDWAPYIASFSLTYLGSDGRYIAPDAGSAQGIGVAETVSGLVPEMVVGSPVNNLNLPPYYPYSQSVYVPNNTTPEQLDNIMNKSFYEPHLPYITVFPLNATVTVYSIISKTYLPLENSGNVYAVNWSKILSYFNGTVLGVPSTPDVSLGTNITSMALISPLIINVSAPGFVSQSRYIPYIQGTQDILNETFELAPLSGHITYGYIMFPSPYFYMQSHFLHYADFGPIYNDLPVYSSDFFLHAFSPDAYFNFSNISFLYNRAYLYTDDAPYWFCYLYMWYPQMLDGGGIAPVFNLTYQQAVDTSNNLTKLGPVFPFELYSSTAVSHLNITGPYFGGENVTVWNNASVSNLTVRVNGSFFYPVSIYHEPGSPVTAVGADVNGIYQSLNASDPVVHVPIPDPWTYYVSAIYFEVEPKGTPLKYNYTVEVFPSSRYYAPVNFSMSMYLPIWPFVQEADDNILLNITSTAGFLADFHHRPGYLLLTDGTGFAVSVNGVLYYPNPNENVTLPYGSYTVTISLNTDPVSKTVDITSLNTTVLNVYSFYHTATAPTPYSVLKGYFDANYTSNDRVYPINDGTVDIYYNNQLIGNATTAANGSYQHNISLYITGQPYGQWPNGTLPVRVVFSIPYGPSASAVVYLKEYGITWFNETIRFNGTFTVGGFSFNIPSWLLPFLAAVLGIGILLLASWLILYVASIMAASLGGIYVFIRVLRIVSRKMGDSKNGGPKRIK